ncbi:hypothetical protein Fmac_009261 [Flemingia macrophylla]|uniref:Uncharacterized protein n=1 Tax=Flemingia macrophylla TaxID=520843 RepID=A0ABD1MZR0_9FABA
MVNAFANPREYVVPTVILDRLPQLGRELTALDVPSPHRDDQLVWKHIVDGSISLRQIRGWLTSSESDPFLGQAAVE